MALLLVADDEPSIRSMLKAHLALAGHECLLTQLPKLPVDRRDELGVLARAFAAMQSAVKSREDALGAHAQGRQDMLDSLAHELARRFALCWAMPACCSMRHCPGA